MYPAYLRGVPPTPASVPRTPLPAATSGAKAYGPGLVAAEVGCAATFTVETLDPYDERRRSGGDVVVARLMVGSEVTVEAFSLDNQDGSFQCTYVPKSVDHRQKLHVTVNGIPVRGSPFRPELSSGPVAAKACTASGPELYDSVAGVPTTIMVQARDCFGNPLRSGGHSFKMHVCAVAPNRSSTSKSSARLSSSRIPTTWVTAPTRSNGVPTYLEAVSGWLPAPAPAPAACTRSREPPAATLPICCPPRVLSQCTPLLTPRSLPFVPPCAPPSPSIGRFAMSSCRRPARDARPITDPRLSLPLLPLVRLRAAAALAQRLPGRVP